MPATWKHARVSLIYKTGDKAECGNYRPISVLCGISKVIERHVHDALYTYLTQHSLLFAAQSGFRPKHSCETALLRMVDLWAAAIDRGDINGVILLDFRKAFDLINHECLLKKLNIYQCDDNANMWFRSYLTGRTQRTSFRWHLSETAAITAGVPRDQFSAHCFSSCTRMTFRFTSTMTSTCLLMTLPYARVVPILKR